MAYTEFFTVYTIDISGPKVDNCIPECFISVALYGVAQS